MKPKINPIYNERIFEIMLLISKGCNYGQKIQ